MESEGKAETPKTVQTAPATATTVEPKKEQPKAPATQGNTEIVVKIIKKQDNKFIPKHFNYLVEENELAIRYIDTDRETTPENVAEGALVKFSDIKTTISNSKKYYFAGKVEVVF